MKRFFFISDLIVDFDEILWVTPSEEGTNIGLKGGENFTVKDITFEQVVAELKAIENET